MTKSSDADAPLKGKPPAPDQMRDPSPKGGTPNASAHVDDKPVYHTRQGKYPAAKQGLGDPGGDERKR